MKKIILLVIVLFTLNKISAQVQIIKIEGGQAGIAYLKGVGSPNTETTNIANALATMGMTLMFGCEYIDEDGDKYRYINIAGGQWRKTSHTAAP